VRRSAPEEGRMKVAVLCTCQLELAAQATPGDYRPLLPVRLVRHTIAVELNDEVLD
jgi:hypothetical protein